MNDDPSEWNTLYFVTVNEVSTMLSNYKNAHKAQFLMKRVLILPLLRLSLLVKGRRICRPRKLCSTRRSVSSRSWTPRTREWRHVFSKLKRAFAWKQCWSTANVFNNTEWGDTHYNKRQDESCETKSHPWKYWRRPRCSPGCQKVIHFN